MHSKNKKKLRKFSKKGGKTYKGNKMFSKEFKEQPIIIQWDHDTDFQGFKDTLTDRLNQIYDTSVVNVILKKYPNAKDAQDLSEFTDGKFFFNYASDPIKKKEKENDQIIKGKCNEPSYPGNTDSTVDLEEIINTINRYIDITGIDSIKFFIGGIDDSIIASEPCIKIYALSEGQTIEQQMWLGYFPLNIPADISHSDDIHSKKLYKFLKDLYSIVFSQKGTQIKWKVQNNICCTCFPIFEYLTNVLNFEYNRSSKGQGCGDCTGICKSFALSCLRPELIQNYNKLPEI
jgi:hypothetical protein